MVDVSVKVLKAANELVVNTGQRKVDLTVADESGSCRLAIWDDEIDQMLVGHSYSVCGVAVRLYGNQRFFSTSKKGSVIKEIEALGDVKEEGVEEPVFENTSTMKNVRVVTVEKLDKYRGCYKCRSKLSFEDGAAECPKCFVVQSESGAKDCYIGCLGIQGDGESRRMKLSAYEKVLSNTAGLPIEELTARDLIIAPPFEVTYRDATYHPHSSP